jgi:16S rRNA (uracil1498-N3)-methyltransferase
MHRFYAPDLDSSRPAVALPADEARHLTRVLRLAPGAIVAVFDGRGGEFAARITSARRGRVSLESLGPRETARESTLAITLAQAVLKANKMDDVVRDAVMLGVAAIQPVVSSRAETSVSALHKARRVERWRRIAVASAKQCGRARVPDVHEPVTLDALLAHSSGKTQELKLALVEPSHHHGRSLETLKELPPPKAALVLIGPEGGWRPEEIDRLSTGGFHLVTLGSRTLRAEAAPLAVLTLIQFLWGDL